MYPYIRLYNFYIPTYGLSVFVAVLLSSILVFKKAQKLKLDLNDIIILVAVLIGCGTIGGCLLYILVTYDVETICRQLAIGELSFVKKSGTVFYGGLIGGFWGAMITIKILKLSVESIEMCIVPYIPLGHAIGRIGCLLAGCCYGAPYSGIFAISTNFGLSNETYFPIQGIEALLNLLIMGILLFYIKKKRFKYSTMCLYLIMYSSLRFCLEFFRGDSIRGNYLFFSTSQWISLIIFLFALILMRKSQNFKKEKV